MKITDHPSGATPLEPEDLEALIPDLSSRGELIEWEQQNILDAKQWAEGNRRLGRKILTIDRLKRLHKRMFDRTWTWAGEFRQRAVLPVGVDPWEIGPALLDLCDDAAYWVEHRIHEWPELGARFHHRLVSIHPFSNGNGRHARLAADVLLAYYKQPPLLWGEDR